MPSNFDTMSYERSSDTEALIPKSSQNGSAVHYGATKDGVVEVESGGFHLSGSREHMASTISVHNCFYEVPVKSTACGPKIPKTILKEINAVFKPGMNAILGPTGSGKSSLLDILAGRKDPSGLKGTLLIDGAPPPDNFKCMVGYVVQDDVVMGTLTIRENFRFSASLRLPSDTTKSEKELRVNAVIEELGLSACADTRVGNEFIRGVSGGERKRTNIGMELIISPPVLFLDEPTTGLDASTANSVMYLLKRMALKGRTIVFSIHQPRFTIYKVFDNLTLLSEGEIIYQGPAPDALSYFKSIGYVCEQHNNPPDFFLDVINGDYAKVRNMESTIMPNSKDDKDVIQKKLVEKYQQSQCYRSLKNQVQDIYDTYCENNKRGELERLPRVKYASSFFKQLLIVSSRTVKNILRSPQTSILQLFVMVVFGLIVGAIYFNMDTSPSFAFQNRAGAFFFIVMNQIFGNLGAVELFIKERSIFMHENVSGFYRVSSYFISKVFCDVIPMRLFPVVVFGAIVYWMIGLRGDWFYFLYFLLDLFLTALAACGLAFVVSASVRIFAIANLLIALAYVFMMLFGGLLVNLDSVASWLDWLKWLSIFRYSVEALSINEMKDRQFCGPGGPNGTQCVNGNDYLSTQGIAYTTTFDLWLPQIALGGFSFLFLLLSYVQLRRLKKLK